MRIRWWIVTFVIVGLLAAACGDDDGGSASEETGADEGGAVDGDDTDASGVTTTTLQNGRSTEVTDLRSGGEGGEQRPRVVAQDNRFVAENVRVDAGATVEWRNDGQADHNILPAREGQEIPGEEQPFGVIGEVMAPGDTYRFRFTEPGVYEYYCSLHGTPDQGMVGTIVVGDVDYVPAVALDPIAKVDGTLRVPQDYETIQDAVDHADEGALVLVDEGVYEEAVVVNSPNIVIRGMDRNETVLDGGHEFANAFHVFADGVAIENMKARNYTVNGFFWDGVDGYRGSYLTTERVKTYGIYAFASVNGQFDHSYASGSDDGGFYIGQCKPCNALIVDSFAENNQLGYSGTNASDLVIARSSFMRNRVGIVPNSWDVEDLAPVERNHYVGNVVVDNNNIEAPSGNELYDLGNRVGILLGGTVDSIVERNLIVDHEFAGMMLTAFPRTDELDDFYEATGNVVRDNVISDSGRADIAVILDNPVNDNCYANNVMATSIPPDIQSALPCEGPRVESFGDPNFVGEVLNRDEPEGLTYKDMPLAPAQENMPGDPATAPAVPATADVVPMQMDLAAIALPESPDDLTGR